MPSVTCVVLQAGDQFGVGRDVEIDKHVSHQCETSPKA